MADLKPAVIDIYADYGGAVRRCRRDIVARDWFGADWWINLSFDNNGWTLQLSKTNWFNHLSRGIHFEFWIATAEVELRTVPVVLHFEPDVPDRKALGARFKAAFGPFEQDFDDYRVNHQAVCDKLMKNVPLKKSSLREVVAEFDRLQQLAAVIDSII